MSQTIWFVALHLLGMSVGLAVVGTRPGATRLTHLACALGFSVGLAVMVPVVLLLCTLGLPFTRVSIGGIAAVIAAFSWWRIARGGIERSTLRAVAIWTAGFAVVCVPLTFPNLSFLTFDSHTIVMLGGAVFDDGGFAPGMVEQFSDWGVFQVIAHSFVGFSDESYLYSLSTVLGASTIPVFVITLQQGLRKLGIRERRSVWLAIAMVTAVTFTNYMLLRHFFYIHTNLGSAVYMFEYVVLFWLAEVSDEEDTRRLLPLAFLALLALSLHRIENTFICVLLLAMTVLQSKQPARWLLTATAVYTVAVAAWFAVLAMHVSSTSEFLTPTKCLASAGITVAFLLYALVSLGLAPRFLVRLNRVLPFVVAGIVALALVYAFATKTEHMKISIMPLLENIWLSESWSGVWALITCIAIVGLFAPAPPSRNVFVWGIPIYLALIVLLAYGRTPYRTGTGDSGTRMAMHLIPMTMFYFGVKFIPLLLREPSPRS
jgi:hypothetical protein